MNNKTQNITKSELLEFFTDTLAERPQNVEIYPRSAKLNFDENRTLLVMLSARRPDEFYPEPRFLFTSDHLADAKAIGARATIAYSKTLPRQFVLVRHSELSFYATEDGEFYGVYGL